MLSSWSFPAICSRYDVVSLLTQHVEVFHLCVGSIACGKQKMSRFNFNSFLINGPKPHTSLNASLSNALWKVK